MEWLFTGERVRRIGSSRPRGELFVGGSLLHTTSLTSKFKYSLQYIHDCQDDISYSDMNVNRRYILSIEYRQYSIIWFLGILELLVAA
jgi:hypothetical protein